jgi:hypothetical protein
MKSQGSPFAYQSGGGSSSSGSSVLSVVSKTTTYTAQTSDDVILCSTTGGSWTLSLYTAVGNNGRQLVIKKTTSDTNVLTVDPDGTETIDGDTTRLLQGQYSSLSLFSDGTNWIVRSFEIPNNTTYLKHVVANNTAGGGATSGSWIKRTLNTQTGATWFTSLSSDQFALPAGLYQVYASGPFFQTGSSRLKIANITDTTDAILSQSTSALTTNSEVCEVELIGEISITATKTFELQYRVQSTKTTNGLGIAGNLGSNEVFGMVQITKVK